MTTPDSINHWKNANTKRALKTLVANSNDESDESGYFELTTDNGFIKNFGNMDEVKESGLHGSLVQYPNFFAKAIKIGRV